MDADRPPHADLVARLSAVAVVVASVVLPALFPRLQRGRPRSLRRWLQVVAAQTAWGTFRRHVLEPQARAFDAGIAETRENAWFAFRRDTGREPTPEELRAGLRGALKWD